MLLLQTMAIVSLHRSTLRKIIRSAKREQHTCITISERKDDFQGATPIQTYKPLNKCEVK